MKMNKNIEWKKSNIDYDKLNELTHVDLVRIENGKQTINKNRTKESCSRGGKIGGKNGGNKAKELKLGFHSLTSEERSKIGKKVGDVIGPRSHIEGFGIFGLSDEEKTKVAIYGGQQSAKSPKHPNNVKVKCEHCTFETSLPLYKRWHGENCKHKK
jgi:hypothetical protein